MSKKSSSQSNPTFARVAMAALAIIIVLAMILSMLRF